MRTKVYEQYDVNEVLLTKLAIGRNRDLISAVDFNLDIVNIAYQCHKGSKLV